MAELRSEKTDKIKMVTIVSGRFGCGKFPDPGVEDEQRLTINDRGGVYFTAYGWEIRNITRHEYINIGVEKARQILKLLQDFLLNSNSDLNAKNASRWYIHAKMDGGKSIKTDGSIIDCIEYDGINVSNYIRCRIPINNLIVLGE